MKTDVAYPSSGTHRHIWSHTHVWPCTHTGTYKGTYTKFYSEIRMRAWNFGFDFHLKVNLEMLWEGRVFPLRPVFSPGSEQAISLLFPCFLRDPPVLNTSSFAAPTALLLGTTSIYHWDEKPSRG